MKFFAGRVSSPAGLRQAPVGELCSISETKAREVTRLKGYAHHVAPTFFAAPVTPDHRMREQNRSSTLLDSAVFETPRVDPL